MQLPSSSTAPVQLAPPSGLLPEIVKTPVKPPIRWPWWAAATILLVVVVGYVLYKRQATTSEIAVAHTVRTARVGKGTVRSTIRLNGSTAAANSASLVVPSLRGSRGDSGRDRGSVQSAAAPPTLSAAPANIGPTGSSTGTTGNLSSALKASTSRVGGTSTTTSSSSTTSTTAASAALGASGLGSTSDALAGGGGGGGGGGDFLIVLEKVVKPGSLVKKGQVIAELDRQNMLMRLDDYKASVVQTQASLLKLKSDLTITRHAHQQSVSKAKAALDKARLDLKTLPVLSAIDAERAKLALQEHEARYQELQSEAALVTTSLNAQIRNAEINLQQSNIELKRAETNVERMVLKAPIDGLTAMSTVPMAGELRQLQQGDQLYPGTLFMSVVDPKSMIVNATVNQADVELMRIGLKAEVRFDAYPGLVLTAHVYSIGGIAKPGGQRATYLKEIPVRLKLDEMDPRVIPDLSVSADVLLGGESRETVVAPVEAIMRDGAPSTAAFVMVESPSGWVRRQVELGVANNIQVAVRSGLAENEIVALERPSETVH